MGNNHNKYFNSQKRKVLILGLSASGKTSNLHHLNENIAMMRMIKGDQKGKGSLYVPTELFNNEQIRIQKKIELDVWDLGGKLPHLWVHHFKGTQGIVFIIDEIQTSLDDQKRSSVV